MKVLLDTNILIHREAARVVSKDIGTLFFWLDRLGYAKCVHPVSVAEIEKLSPGQTREAFEVKLKAYQILRSQAPLSPAVENISRMYDQTVNDLADTRLLNELHAGRVDILITEDRKIKAKALQLGLGDRVFTIEGFIERAVAENPALADYKVLSVKKEVVGTLAINDPFFDSLREDYADFDRWLARKSNDEAYICRMDAGIVAFLYLKPELPGEYYGDIFPPLPPKRRLKIGTLKVTLNGFRLGERLLKITFDNALRWGVSEIYTTVFEQRLEHQRLISLLEDFGFRRWGTKNSASGAETVLVRDFTPHIDLNSPATTFPFYSTGRVFFASVYPQYHTNLFPDSILRTESPRDYVENEPYRNAIRKVFVSRSLFRELRSGDTLLFYRTGGYFRGVATTIGIVEEVVPNVPNLARFKELCRSRSVFSDQELEDWWNYKPRLRPFVVKFLYAYSLPHRVNLKRLIDLGVVQSVQAVPRGFEAISTQRFRALLAEAGADERLVVD